MTEQPAQPSPGAVRIGKTSNKELDEIADESYRQIQSHGSNKAAQPSQYRCDEDDINCLNDYFMAALNGEEPKEKLLKLWQQELGVVRHSLLSQQQEPAPINPNDRRTCQFQEIQCYPGDEFVMCHSSEKCEYRHPSSVPPDIFCNKEVISYESAIAAAAFGLEKLNEQFDVYDRIYHVSHSKGLITDEEMLQFTNEVSTVKRHLVDVLNKAGRIDNGGKQE